MSVTTSRSQSLASRVPHRLTDWLDRTLVSRKAPAAAACSVVRLKCSRLVGRGRVLVSDATRVALDAAAHASVQLRVLKLPEIAPRQLTLKLLADRQRADSVDTNAVREAFAHWLAQRPESLVAHTGALVAFAVGDERMDALVHVSYDDADAPTPQLQQLDSTTRSSVSLVSLVTRSADRQTD